jgi:glycosyltransferase involved in cell wall biosynthesis
MRFVFLSYINTPAFDRPEDWIRRISGYTGILEALSRQHSVMSIEQINYEGGFSSNGVHYHFLNFGKGTGSYPMRLNSYVKSLKPDIVLVHGLHFPLQVMLLRRQLGGHVRIIAQHHAERPGRWHRKILQRMADRSVYAYLFTSREMGMEWVEQGIITRTEKIREVMEASSAFQPLDRALAKVFTGVSGDPVYLWVGRLNGNKDPLTVVRAFLQFVRVRPTARLYMIFHTDELLAGIKSLLNEPGNMGEAVILSGRKPHEEMQHWYNAADFILSGSHYEAGGIAVCEAMSCGGIPVLTSILSFRKMTDRGNCGILYEPGNEDALLEALLQTVNMDVREERDKVIRQFNTHLSFEAIARGIQDIAGSL